MKTIKKVSNKLILALLLMVVCLTGCGASEQEVLEDGKLIIYYVENHAYYGTALGEFYSRYQDIYDIQVVPFETEETMNTQLQTEIAAGMGPDVVLTTADSDLDIYKMVQSGNLEPLDTYLEEDQTFHEEDFYMPVIEGGKLQGAQYIMPFSFCLDVMYMCEEEPGQYVSEEPADFDGMLKLLDDVQKHVDEEKVSVNYFYQNMLGGIYVHFLVNSGMEFVTEDGFASPELEQITPMMEYLQNNRDEYMNKQNLDISKRKRLFDIYECFTMNNNYVSGRLYAKAEMPEEGENYILTEIPWKNVNGKPQPMITDYGFVMGNSDCKDGAFALLRYFTISDSVYMSVNRDRIKERFDYARVNYMDIGRRIDGSPIEGVSITKEQKDAALATLDTMDTAIVANMGYYKIIGDYMKECLNEKAVWDVTELESRVERYLGE